MYTVHNNLGLPGLQLARMLTSILPFLALAAPAVLLAGEVSNTASVSAPAGSVDANAGNNQVTHTDDLAARIVAMPDSAAGISTLVGLAGAVNVFSGDTLDGVVATPANAVLSMAPGATLPAGISFDTATGMVSVAPGTTAGQYAFDYQICELALPDNCAVAAVTLDVVVPLSVLAGTVYLDVDGNRMIDSSDRRLAGWTVEVVANNAVVAQVITTADGSYAFPGLPGGVEYTIRFREPETGIVFEQIEGIFLEQATTLPNQNLPIDPSGVVYDAITREPVAGAVVSLVDRNGNPLPDDCYLDVRQNGQVTGDSGAYRIDLMPGEAAACPLGEASYTLRVTPPAGYSFTSTILPPRRDPLDPTGLTGPVQVSNSALPPQASDPVYYITFELQTGDPDVVNNHVPLDPFLTREGLVVTKSSTLRSASTGDLVPYEIVVRNDEAYRRAGVNVIDVLPDGLTYVTGSARVNGVAAEPELANGNREIVWTDQVIPPNGSMAYNLVLTVGAGVTEGQVVNTGVAESALDGSEISNRGTASVAIVASSLFDCSELIGQVFQDHDGDGYQDDGEPGIPSVRLATVNGELITTDEHGRYHITCAAVPDARIGSNFVLRLDERTLPQGWAITTDNPRSVRLTRGKMSQLNFGAAEVDLVSLAIDGRAFATDGSLQPHIRQRLQTLVEGEQRAMVVRATYALSPSDDPAQIEARIAHIRQALAAIFAEGWEGPEPIIQVDVTGAAPAGEGEQ